MYGNLGTKLALLLPLAGGWLAMPNGIALAPQSSAHEVTQTEQNTETVSGKVAKLLRNDHNDVDGLALENGREVHFPPHVGKEVEKHLKAGDSVIVVGREETRPKGEKVFAAVRLEAKAATIKVGPPKDKPEPKPGLKPGPKGDKPPAKHKPGPPEHAKQGPPPKHEAAQPETPMKVVGKVEKLLKNDKGDIDGLLLADKTEVKFPPHQGEALAKLVAVGDEVKVAGHRHEGPNGDVHLHARIIVAVASGKTLEREGPGHPGEVPPKPKHDGPKHDGPKHGPKHGGPEKPKHDEPPPHEEILRELRELRKLVEEKLGDQPAKKEAAEK
jgi:hypothetical protein